MNAAGAGNATARGQVVIAHEIADFVLATSWSSVPEIVRREARRAFLNWIACAVGGANTATAEIAIRAVTTMGGAGNTPLPGRPERFDLANAALLSCLNSAAQAFDDTHLKTITHPTGPVAAAVLAALHHQSANGVRASGADLLLALVVGIEIECRLSNAIFADGAGADLGWYMTGLSGGVGAAVAVGRLLGLDHDQMVCAIGLATAQACGVRSTHGSMATAYVPAVACRNGLTAAYMAAAGFTCGEGAIDGNNGLLQVMSPNAAAGCISDGLGSEFELLRNAYKPYPCGIVIHPAIDACLALAADPAFKPELIERLDLRVHPDALNLTGRKLPDSALAAQISIYHWVATALLRRRAGIAESELPCVRETVVRALQDAVFPVRDATLASDQAYARLTMKGGRVLEARVEHATGSAAKPMTDRQLEEKFRALTSRVLDEEKVARLLAVCRHMDAAPDPLEVFHASTP